MPDALLTPELLRRLEQFQLLAARRAKSSAKGERRSRARGQSVEFADYRNYVHGDDFRYLDWNLYGRLERLFLKLYEEERELPVRIFLDASESMTFGEPRKFDFARQVAAAIGYVALSGFDRVSVIPFPDLANDANTDPGARIAELAARGALAFRPRQEIRHPVLPEPGRAHRRRRGESQRGPAPGRARSAPGRRGRRAERFPRPGGL